MFRVKTSAPGTARKTPTFVPAKVCLLKEMKPLVFCREVLAEVLMLAAVQEHVQAAAFVLHQVRSVTNAASGSERNRGAELRQGRTDGRAVPREINHCQRLKLG